MHLQQLQPAPGSDAIPALLAGAVTGTTAVAGEMPLNMPHAPLPALAAIAIAVGGLEQGRAGPAHLRDLEANLVTMLTTMERNPGVEAAAEDLYRAAAAFLQAARVPEDAPGPRLVRVLRESLSRLQDRIFSACGVLPA